MDTLFQDLRYAFRTLLKTPGFTLIAVLSLALGIGANTAIFSIIDALLLRQLPVRDPQSLVLFGEGRGMGIFGGVPGRAVVLVSEAELAEIRKDKQLFVDAAGTFSLPWTYHAFVAGATTNEPIRSRLVTGNFFSMLGVRAAAGHLLTDGDDAPLNTHANVVLSHAFWKRRFGANPAAVGTTLKIGERLYTIVGVAQPEFTGTMVDESPDAWFPVSMMSQLPPYFDFHADKLAHLLYVVARLQPGVSAQQAAAAETIRFRQLLRSYLGSTPSKPDLDNLAKTSVELTPAAAGLSRLWLEISGMLKVLMGVVGLVLLIACANVANLLLVRATVREREMAIRFAIGSGRGRVIRQLLTESLLLSIAGGLLGIVFSMWGSHLLLALVTAGPDPLPLSLDPNFNVLAFALGVSLLTGVGFGLAPAFRASATNVNSGLRDGRSGTASRGRTFAGRALVVAQVSLSLLLVVGAGLFIRSFQNLQSVGTGFDREHVFVVSLDTDAAGYQQDQRLSALYQQIERKAAQIPGVESAAFSMFGFEPGAMALSTAVEGHPEIRAEQKSMRVNVTGPAYLDTLGGVLIAGRYFRPSDTPTSPKVAVIGEKAARDIFGNGSPLGKHISVGDVEKGLDTEIVGVVKDIKHQNLREEATWSVYVPYTQRFEFLSKLMVRVRGNSAPVLAEVRKAIADTDRNLPVGEVTSMSELVDRSLNTQHLVALLSTFFGALALLLAAIGLYGILSYSVARRTSEIGVRMALGAQSHRVLWMVLRETLLMVALGIGIGIPVALVCTRLLRSMLFGLGSIDVVSTIGAICILATVGTVAGLLPARRASKVDPMVALRYE